MNTKNLQAVLNLYDSGAILKPTFSNRILRDSESLKWYFSHLCKRPGLEVTLHENTFTVQNIERVDVLSGLYRFGYYFEGDPLKFEARFTFVVDPNNPRPIIHHHSSQLPRTLS